MLVLKRLPGQRLRLTCPGGLEIWVDLISTDRARGPAQLGITAPRGVVVEREELIRRDDDDEPTSVHHDLGGEG